MTSDQIANPVDIAYLITGICFILGLRYLNSPKTARLGNRISMAGMLIALVATLTQGIVGWWQVGAGIAIGAAVGIYSARVVKMTAMPQMVAPSTEWAAARLRWLRSETFFA